MTRLRALVAIWATVLGLLVAAAPAGAAPSGRTLLPAGTVLKPGQVLRSSDGAFTATLGRRGHLVVRHGSRLVWATRPVASEPRLRLTRAGNLAITSGRRTVWSTRTRHATALVLRNSGVLALRSAAGTVWTYRTRNRCSTAITGKRVLVDLGTQSARLCNGGTQVLATPITSGASAYGNGTPTGTWRVQSKQRERYLYPAAGGAYYVHYWIPYDGAYGMHDSSWQDFPYGSQQYRTRGSHGCVHFPLAAIRFMYGWLRVGTLVRIHS